MFFIEMPPEVFLIRCAKLTFCTIISLLSMFSFYVTFQMIFVADEFTPCTFIFYVTMAFQVLHETLTLICGVVTLFAGKVYPVMKEICFQHCYLLAFSLDTRAFNRFISFSFWRQNINVFAYSFLFGNFCFYVRVIPGFTAAFGRVDDLNVSQVDAEELGSLKEVKGAEDGVLGDVAGGEQGEQEGDGQSRHRDRDGGWRGGGGGGGDELVEVRGIESEEEAAGWEVEALGGDQPQVWWQGGQGGDQGGEAG